MATLTPMMQQYLNIHEQAPDALLFFRLGDFYEMFFDDAILVSKELDLTLTGRDCGLDERAPMCGVPARSAEQYFSRLVEKGYRVAICDQTEDPKFAKGMVKRQVTRIVTPGTNLCAQAESSRNNYVMCVIDNDERYNNEYFDRIKLKNISHESDKTVGISIADLSTGEFLIVPDPCRETLLDEICKFQPGEIICDEDIYNDFAGPAEKQNICGYPVYRFDINSPIPDTDVISRVLELIGGRQASLNTCKKGVWSAIFLLQFLKGTQFNELPNIVKIRFSDKGGIMASDRASRQNLELTQSLSNRKKKGSLLWVMDNTVTSGGARLLRNYIEAPLVLRTEIEKRLELVGFFVDNARLRVACRDVLEKISDIERLISRAGYGNCGPKELLALADSFEKIPEIIKLLENTGAPKIPLLLEEISSDLEKHEDLSALALKAFVEELPANYREGGFIRSGFDKIADEYSAIKRDAKTLLAQLEEDERSRTGIKGLKIKYNRVFSYYYEVTKSNINQVPKDYLRKQTLSNAERYTNERLQELESKILGADERLIERELELFETIKRCFIDKTAEILKSASALSSLDVFLALAALAENNRYTKPSINAKGILDIKGARHPVLEKIAEYGHFISNDTYLDSELSPIAIITGPNMAGKSTYMRQTALIVLMAQIGSFVPADMADICVVDRIFTRVGASDDIFAGNSTFMVEMQEVANILSLATGDSLLILDEIGRGTSTYDGLAIAWAVVENIAYRRIKTLFATHYHELTELEKKLPGVNNYRITVSERGERIIFLRKIVKGCADKSYGIAVARLAGVDEGVIKRARQILRSLSEADVVAAMEKKHARMTVPSGQISFDGLDETRADNGLPNADEIYKLLLDCAPDELSPMAALNLIYRLKALAE